MNFLAFWNKFVCLPLCIYLFAFQTLHFLVPGALDKELLCIFIDEIYFYESGVTASSIVKICLQL